MHKQKCDICTAVGVKRNGAYFPDTSRSKEIIHQPVVHGHLSSDPRSQFGRANKKASFPVCPSHANTDSRALGHIVRTEMDSKLLLKIKKWDTQTTFSLLQY